MQKIESFYQNYELIDCGDGRRLERFGQYILDRPASQALDEKKLDNCIWYRADFIFNGKEWLKKDESRIEEMSWNIKISNINFKLKLSKTGQVGIFPEQFINWVWLADVVKDHLELSGSKLYTEQRKFSVLNAFAYTGGSSLFPANVAKDFPAEICHLDGSKPAVNWAGENAKLNDLTNIRWMIDDVVTFLKREIRREKFYNGIILGPPAFGRGKNKTWSFSKGLEELLLVTKAVISPAGPLFFVLSCHEPTISLMELKDRVSDILEVPARFFEALKLEVPSARGNPLPCGICVRFKKS